MNNTVTPLLTHGHPVLGVTELLENILLNLSPGDTLYNAQAVCKFWKDCIQGSNTVKKKCFLVADIISEEDTDRTLFLGARLPDLRERVLPLWRNTTESEKLCSLPKVTPTTLRALCVANPTTGRGLYKRCIQDYFKQLNDYDENIRLLFNMGHVHYTNEDDTEDDSRVWESLLDMSCSNPLLCQSWKGKRSAVFTGYRKHMVFALGDNYPEACEYFAHIRAFLEIIVHAMSTDQSRRIWNTVQVSSPAVTELTIAIWLPALCEITRTVQQDAGITMRDFADVFIMTVQLALSCYGSDNIERWMGVIHRHRRGGVTWKELLHSYKQERSLIEDLIRELQGLGVVQRYLISSSSQF